MNYLIKKIPDNSEPSFSWTGSVWREAAIAEISCFRPESSSHRPQTAVKLVYSTKGIHGIFRVMDKFIICKGTEYFDPVYLDSCVEFFILPKQGRGYFNFEFNCCGAFLCSYIVDPTRTPDGFKKYSKIPREKVADVRVYHSLQSPITQEIPEPTEWLLGFFIPFKLLEEYVGPIGTVSGQRWRVNFYKCADDSSHPHWASWSCVKALNFHMPECFGDVAFE